MQCSACDGDSRIMAGTPSSHIFHGPTGCSACSVMWDDHRLEFSALQNVAILSRGIVSLCPLCEYGSSTSVRAMCPEDPLRRANGHVFRGTNFRPLSLNSPLQSNFGRFGLFRRMFSFSFLLPLPTAEPAGLYAAVSSCLCFLSRGANRHFADAEIEQHVLLCNMLSAMLRVSYAIFHVVDPWHLLTR